MYSVSMHSGFFNIGLKGSILILRKFIPAFQNS